MPLLTVFRTAAVAAGSAEGVHACGVLVSICTGPVGARAGCVVERMPRHMQLCGHSVCGERCTHGQSELGSADPVSVRTGVLVLCHEAAA